MQHIQRSSDGKYFLVDVLRLITSIEDVAVDDIVGRSITTLVSLGWLMETLKHEITLKKWEIMSHSATSTICLFVAFCSLFTILIRAHISYRLHLMAVGVTISAFFLACWPAHCFAYFAISTLLLLSSKFTMTTTVVSKSASFLNHSKPTKRIPKGTDISKQSKGNDLSHKWSKILGR